MSNYRGSPLSVEAVYEARMLALDNNVSDIPTRSDYANEEEYRRALEMMYLDGRQLEYQYHVQNEAMKAYNVSYGENKNAGARVQNGRAWGGYRTNAAARDTCYNYTPEIVNATARGANNLHCCAISSTSYTYALSERMGYCGDDNLIVPKSRVVNGHVGRANNCYAANSIHFMDSIPPEYTASIKSAARSGGSVIPENMTLSQGIQQGLIGVGDEFSIRTGQADGNTTTGCHAMYLVNIERDENGNVVSYTLGGNNPPTLEVVGATQFASHYYGSKPLVSVVNTGEWVRDQDLARVENMSIEELEQAVANQKGAVSSVIEDMKESEYDYMDLNGHTPVARLGRAGGYKSYYEGLTASSLEYISDCQEADEVAARAAVEIERQKSRERMASTMNLIDSMGVDLEAIGVKGVSDDAVLEVDEPETLEIIASTEEVGETYTQEERLEIEQVVDGQIEDSEIQLQDNIEAINEGSYGSDVEQVVEQIEVYEVAAREKTAAELAKENKMQTWFKSVKLDPALVDVMVSKYGVDIAYDLALKSLMEPAGVAQGIDGAWRNSKDCIRYFIENDVADETVAGITGKSVESVRAGRPVRVEEREKIVTCSNNGVRAEMDRYFYDRIYGSVNG